MAPRSWIGWTARRFGPAALFLAPVAVAACGHAAGDPPSAHTAAVCYRPYSGSSPWNTPIPAGAYDSGGAQLISTIGGPLTSDPTQYTYPVYVGGSGQPRRSVRIDAAASIVLSPGRLARLGSGFRFRVPVSPSAQPAQGSDGQVIILDPSTHQEWDFWQFRNSGGRMSATDGSRYNDGWSGVPPRGFTSRGAGVPYLAGLVRPCEIARGHIAHALALVLPRTTWQHLYPATKSDGHSSPGNGLPEGARLQLNPYISDTAIRNAWGCRGSCFTIAKALQQYGMYVVDTGGHPKIVVEYQGTAHWQGSSVITRSTVSSIPVSLLRVVAAR
jgi:hypothetical protein